MTEESRAAQIERAIREVAGLDVVVEESDGVILLEGVVDSEREEQSRSPINRVRPHKRMLDRRVLSNQAVRDLVAVMATHRFEEMRLRTVPQPQLLRAVAGGGRQCRVQRAQIHPHRVPTPIRNHPSVEHTKRRRRLQP